MDKKRVDMWAVTSVEQRAVAKVGYSVAWMVAAKAACLAVTTAVCWVEL